jgi:hypothetical protein
MPSIARSEGWVSWTKTDYLKTGGSENTHWEINGAHPKYEKCEELNAKLWKVYKKEADDSKDRGSIERVKVVPNVLVIQWIKDPKDIMGITKTVYCLPGTIDPREQRK